MRYRKKVLNADKLKIISELDAGGTHAAIAERHRVSRSLVTRLNSMAQRSRLTVATCNGTSNLSSAAQRTRKYAIIERELFDWFAERRMEKKVISGPILMHKALQIRDSLASDQQIIGDFHDLLAFKASEKWFRGFKSTYHIGLRSIRGTENIVPAEAIIAGRAMIKQEIEGFEYKDVFNVDESGLFYRQLPSQSYLLHGEPGKQLAASKERVTILFCCSSTGEKLPLLIVGKSRKPRSLRNITHSALPCSYTSSENAWMTRQLFRDWIAPLNSTFAAVNRKICIIMDNFSGHVLGQTFSHVKIIYLPPGVTSVLQPLDCGIINSFKCQYRNVVLDSLLNHECEHKISLKEAIFYSARAWDCVTLDTIKNSWRKADITQDFTRIAAESLLEMSAIFDSI